MEYQTADLCDRHETEVRSGQVRVVEQLFRAYGGLASFHGPMATLKLYEDNSLVRQALEAPGHGRVLVIDGGGSRRCALVGDQLAQLGAKNGWAGLVVFGCIRDARAIGSIPIGVFALATHPLKSIKKGIGEMDIPITFGGVTFNPGEYLYADADGILVSPSPL